MSRIPPTDMATIPEDAELSFPVIDQGDVTIVFMPDVPQMKYHDALEMTSQSGMSQKEYEESIKAKGYSANTYDDELIIVICPGLHGKPPAQYEIHRSALARSPVLASYLESDAYLQGCRIYLKFGEDPAICFHVIKVYLEEGIDRYSKTRLRVFVTRLRNGVEKFTTLVQLYKFAKKLELHGLKDLTFAVILELEWEMEAGYCISVASLVFLPNARYDKAIKDWTLKHIGHFSQKLALSEEWMSLVPHLHHELIHHWLIMVTTNARVLSMVQEKVSDETLAQVLADVPTPARQSGNAAMEAGAKTVTEKEDTSGSDETFVEVPKVLAKMAIGSEEEWVDLEDEDAIVKAASSSLPKSIPPQADNSKALVMLGLPVDQKPVSMIYPPLRDPNAKARELLGINDFSKGLIAGRKQTRFMKAKKGVASFNARIIRGHSI